MDTEIGKPDADLLQQAVACCSGGAATGSDDGPGDLPDGFDDQPEGPDRQAARREIEASLIRLAAQLQAGCCVMLDFIRRFEALGGTHGAGTTAEWLNWRCGIAIGAAREKVRVANALPKFPRIDAAFRSGAISYSKVRAITRVATPANEATLLAFARHATASHMERMCALYRRVDGPQALEQANRVYEDRHFNWYTDEDGAMILRGKLSPEDGAVVIKALEVCMDAARNRSFRQAKAAKEAGVNEISEETPELRVPYTAQRADALVAAAKRIIALGVEDTDEVSYSPEPYHIILHVDIDRVAELTEANSAPQGDGPALAPETARRLGCDPASVRRILSRKATPLDYGRRTRAISPALRQALKDRDRGCRFPGCLRKRFLHAHHVRNWAHGGHTCLENLVSLCTGHHRPVHEGGYTIEPDGHGDFVFRDRFGNVISPSPGLPVDEAGGVTGGVAGLIEDNRARGADIGPQTYATAWDGEPVDYDAIIGALMHVDGKDP